MGNTLSLPDVLFPTLDKSKIGALTAPVRLAPPVWQQVNSTCQHSLSGHGHHWWHRTGYALAVLLDKASYSRDAQVDALDFFARFSMPWLGRLDQLGVERWKSFMTDDHNPVELSWDWSISDEPPVVRYAIEPIGEYAGTSRDPGNDFASDNFLEAILKRPNSWNLEWYAHFNTYFTHRVETPKGREMYRMFWGFSIDANEIAGKAYWYPNHKAIKMGISPLEAVSRAIETAPYSSHDNLAALYVFKDFINEQTTAPLEIPSFAIDLVDPSQSRLKIYFRLRDTSWKSVLEVMTLGGRLINKGTEKDIKKGLENLRHLWDSLFGQKGAPDDAQLPLCEHETAGMLYYVDFYLKDKVPRVKIYLPVRHYAQNDWQVMTTVSNYMASAIASRNPSAKSTSAAPLAYINALSSIFGVETLRRSRGKHTYVSCSIRKGGDLRVTSYINPRVNDPSFLQVTDEQTENLLWPGQISGKVGKKLRPGMLVAASVEQELLSQKRPEEYKLW